MQIICQHLVISRVLMSTQQGISETPSKWGATGHGHVEKSSCTFSQQARLQHACQVAVEQPGNGQKLMKKNFVGYLLWRISTRKKLSTRSVDACWVIPWNIVCRMFVYFSLRQAYPVMATQVFNNSIQCYCLHSRGSGCACMRA